MTRTVVFDSPFLLGFDDMRALIERVGRGHDNYPPYNVEALGPAEIRISIAVAGFTADHLAVEVKGAHLTVIASKERGEEAPRESCIVALDCATSTGPLCWARAGKWPRRPWPMACCIST